ncbi:MAG: FAD:protein FMN transferase, partial [Bacteroidetes bacterium]|nr:FAD:protein FMN transferase [Bacteroidota bacterium]
NGFFQVTGYAQGTTYSIVYQDSLKRDLSNSIDSLITDYDSYLSTYVDTSLISQFNNSESSPTSSKTSWKNDFLYLEIQSDGIFEDCFKAAKEIYHATDGAFNPAVYPLVKYWGFLDGKPRDDIFQYEIDSILKIVNFSDSMINLYTDTVSKGDLLFGSTPVIAKLNGSMKIDFNGIAQGHSVDIIGRYLLSLGINNLMVEVGGEVLCKGVNNKNTYWQIGVDKPVENSSPGSKGFQFVVHVNNGAIATSGNYRKFYEKDGIKYAHTINPKTGNPVQHSLLSVTVAADKCVDADGDATAFMVMGMEQTKKFLNANPELHLEVYMIASSGKEEHEVWMTKGFQNLIVD